MNHSLFLSKCNASENMEKLLFNKKILIFFIVEFIILIHLRVAFIDNLKSEPLFDVFPEKNQIFIFESRIKKEFEIKKHVNLNEIESNLPFGKKWKVNQSRYNEINVGSAIDHNFVLETVITTTSIIVSQKQTTKLRLHYSVVNNFKPNDMIKIYSLRNRLREDVEFNFYDASRVEKELDNLSDKGPSIAARLLLPQLTDDSVNKLIIIDNGDALALRDLSIMYNWNMGNNIYMGAPDPTAGMFGKISNKTLDIYINGGNYLIDVKKVKKMNMYNLFLKYKNTYGPPFAEQHMINDIAYGKIGYLPVEFGLVPPFSDDKLFHLKKNKKAIYAYYNLTIISNNSNFLPKTYHEFLLRAYNPIIVHSWSGKWANGKGMNIYRKLCQYFIELSGMKKEICRKLPGYCKII